MRRDVALQLAQASDRRLNGPMLPQVAASSGSTSSTSRRLLTPTRRHLFRQVLFNPNLRRCLQIQSPDKKRKQS